MSSEQDEPTTRFEAEDIVAKWKYDEATAALGGLDALRLRFIEASKAATKAGAMVIFPTEVRDGWLVSKHPAVEAEFTAASEALEKAPVAAAGEAVRALVDAARQVVTDDFSVHKALREALAFFTGEEP